MVITGFRRKSGAIVQSICLPGKSAFVGNSDKSGPSSSITGRVAAEFPASSCRRLRLVIGGRDLEAGAVSVRLHHGGPQGAKPKAEVIANILASIKERRARDSRLPAYEAAGGWAGGSCHLPFGTSSGRGGSAT